VGARQPVGAADARTLKLEADRPDSHTQLIRVVGDLEGSDATALAEILAQTGTHPRRRIVDLSGTTFMDSAGMSALLQVAEETAAAGGKTILVIAEDSYIRRLLAVRGVIHRFEVVATRAEALAL
jgi:anti-sigma B factor antagonist